MIFHVSVSHADDVLDSEGLLDVSMEESLGSVVVVEALDESTVQSDQSIVVDLQVSKITASDQVIVRRNMREHLFKILAIGIGGMELTVKVANLFQNRLKLVVVLLVLAIELTNGILVVAELKINIRAAPVSARYFYDTNSQKTDQKEKTPVVGQGHRQTDRLRELTVCGGEEQDNTSNQTSNTSNTVENRVFFDDGLDAACDGEFRGCNPRLADGVYEPEALRGERRVSVKIGGLEKRGGMGR